MTRLQAGALWCAALAVFVLLNPIAGMEQRDWQERVLLYAGQSAAVVALSGALPPAILGLWIMALAVAQGGIGSTVTVLMTLSASGVYALARRVPVAPIVRGIVAVNVAVMALQAAGAWQAALRLAFPAAVYEVWNPARPLAGLTMGSGDVGCVLAMGAPFCVAGRALWLLPFAVAALLSTSALSAIVAGLAGLAVAFWPQITARLSRDWRMGFGAVAAFGASIFLGREELIAAWTDDRWRVWWTAGKRWITQAPISGFGLGAWDAHNITVRDATGWHRWDQAHFDLLQFGYEMGLVGVILIVTVFAWAYRRAQRAGNRAALGGMAALAVCQFGHFPLHLASAGVVAALVAGEATHE